MGPTLKDVDIAAVATYVRASFRNHAAPISVETVTRARREHASPKEPWTVAELAKTATLRRETNPAPRSCDGEPQRN